MDTKSTTNERGNEIPEIDKKINFLCQAISDAQELIRFTDSKVGFGITIIGVLVALVYSHVKDLIRYQQYFSPILWILLVFAIILIISLVLVAALIIRPTNNPLANVSASKTELPRTSFYMSENVYGSAGKYTFAFHNSSKFKLKDSFEEYTGSLTGCSSADIFNTLSFELLKLSFIRNIKMDRFKVLIRLIIFTAIIVLLFHLVISKELLLIKLASACHT